MSCVFLTAALCLNDEYQTSKEVAFNELLLSGGNRECGKFCFIINQKIKILYSKFLTLHRPTSPIGKIKTLHNLKLKTL
jgi:hypothetical protein